MKSLIIVLILTLLISEFAGAAERTPRILKFYGVPTQIALQLKKRFAYVFDREVSLGEIDEIVRFLMRTGHFANVEAVERAVESGDRETAVIVTILRRIQNVKVQGNRAISNSEVLKILSIEKGQIFERKHLLAAAEDLRKMYENMGYHGARVEIDFELPNDSEVVINVGVIEGPPVRIGQVVIDSPNPELNETITKSSPVRSLRGKILTEDELLEFQKLVTQYLAKNRFLTAKLSSPTVSFNADRTQAKLTYVIENPWKIVFHLEGNAYFVDWTITQQLEEEKVGGTGASPAPDMAEKIRRRYLEIGFANVDVSYSEKLDEKNHELILNFFIKEGKRVAIRKIEVQGTISRPEAYYARFIRITSSDLIGKGYYNRKDIEEGTKRLITELQNQGYLRARIQSQRAEFSADNGSVVVTLVIDEGPLTQIRQIRFEGVESFPKAQLAEALKIKTGSALGLRELEESITTLKNFYRAEGFLEMKIVNENEQNRIVTYNEGNTQATVEFQIFEGPRVRVGSIILQGNSFTKEFVIMRELAFKQGDVLTPEKIDDTIFRLQRLDLFSSVSWRMLEEGTNVSERTIIVEVIEANPGEVITKIGATNERQHLTLRGTLSVGYKNINGTGRGAILRVEPKYSTDPRVSYVEHTITLSYLEPYIFGARNRGRVNLVRQQYLFAIEDKPKDRTLIQEANTISFLAERDLTRHIRFTLNAYSFSNQIQFDRTTYDITETVNIAKTGPGFTFDYRDDTFNPSKGIYAYLNADYADPLLGSSKDRTQFINFVKTTGAVTHYQRILNRKDLVFVTQVRGGYISTIGDDPLHQVPAQEAFFLGGRGTLRGFSGAEDDVIPSKYDIFSDTLPPEDRTLRKFKVTSDSYYGLVKAEIWFPIYKSFGGTIFYDGGAVIVNQPNVYQPDPFRDTAGIGVRVLTPVGPANFEFGWKLDRRLVRVSSTGGHDVREAPAAFHLSIGAL